MAQNVKLLMKYTGPSIRHREDNRFSEHNMIRRGANPPS